MHWPAVSPRIRELIRQGAERALDPPQRWHDDLDRAIFAGPERQRIVEDPELAASSRRAVISSLAAWIVANVSAPGEPVPPDASDAPVTIARDLVRRGLDESALDAYRVGQNVAWQHWMEVIFELTDDPAELRDVLSVSARSIAQFVDATTAEVAARMRAERRELTRDQQARQHELVTLVLQGAPVSAERLRQRLEYPMTGPHHAAVLWTDGSPDVSLAALDRVTEMVARSTREARAVTVVASTGTRWVWTSTAPDLDLLRRERLGSDVHVALGGPYPGLAGFRRAHEDALATQRVLGNLPRGDRLAHHDDVALAALAVADHDAASRFVAAVLGPLATAEPALRQTLRSFLRHQCNVSAAARAEFQHRNTFLRRLNRAVRLLPGHTLATPTEVGVALDLVHWRVLDTVEARFPSPRDVVG